MGVEKGLSAKVVAEAFGVDRRTVSRWLDTGRLPSLTLEGVIELARDQGAERMHARLTALLAREGARS